MSVPGPVRFPRARQRPLVPRPAAPRRPGRLPPRPADRGPARRRRCSRLAERAARLRPASTRSPTSSTAEAIKAIVVRALGDGAREAQRSAASSSWRPRSCTTARRSRTRSARWSQRERVEALLDELLALHPVLERALERLTDSPLVGTMASRFMGRIAGEVLQANKAVADKVPGPRLADVVRDQRGVEGDGGGGQAVRVAHRRHGREGRHVRRTPPEPDRHRDAAGPHDPRGAAAGLGPARRRSRWPG